MINIDEIFDYTSYNIDREPHIVLDNSKCVTCEERWCVNVCPAHCYAWTEEDKKMSFAHDGCLECGSCYILCKPGAFTRWRYPRGGYGVAYRMT